MIGAVFIASRFKRRGSALQRIKAEIARAKDARSMAAIFSASSQLHIT
jgi:hypothetical protein